MTDRRVHSVGLSFQPPEGWGDDSAGKLAVFHGPDDEELIVSGAQVEGGGTGEEAARIRALQLRNGIASIESAAQRPDLQKGVLSELRLSSGLQAWTLTASTEDNRTAFLQAVVAHRASVLVVTMEGANTPELEAVFRSLLFSIQPAPVGRVVLN